MLIIPHGSSVHTQATPSARLPGQAFRQGARQLAPVSGESSSTSCATQEQEAAVALSFRLLMQHVMRHTQEAHVTYPGSTVNGIWARYPIEGSGHRTATPNRPIHHASLAIGSATAGVVSAQTVSWMFHILCTSGTTNLLPLQSAQRAPQRIAAASFGRRRTTTLRASSGIIISGRARRLTMSAVRASTPRPVLHPTCTHLLAQATPARSHCIRLRRLHCSAILQGQRVSGR